MENKTFETEFGNYVNTSVNIQLLKHAASLNIFCPNCERILDFKTVVLIDVYRSRDNAHMGLKTGCIACFKPEGIPALEAKGLIIEVTRYERPIKHI